jgi:hypothetical protein
VDQWILGPIFPLWYGQNWLYSQGLSGDQCLNLFEIAATRFSGHPSEPPRVS